MKWETIKCCIVGKAKNPTDPKIFHRISLIALLAWVGLGADGLSSSCYGPEEAFVILGNNGFLAVYLAIATALTVAVISLSYSQIIELFPFGGGGYGVATKLINPTAGLVAGSALVVDYILTVAISVASGIDALFSSLPIEYQHYKLSATIFIVLLLIILNLRGVKESITILLPIFIAFILTHLIMLGSAFIQNAGALPGFFSGTVTQTKGMVHNMGTWAFILIILKSYSHGAGTYTGIEAVSNAMPTLREPRAQTGKRAMLYMALSLGLLSGGLLVLYGIFNVSKVHGETLNASLFNRIIESWNTPFGSFLVTITLISEGLLLFIAAQSGFIGGPQVMSSMSLDYWLPRRFAHLSERLTISNGIIFMGLSSIVMIMIAKGQVAYLVVLYSINVFITFSLSQFGMCRHWLRERKQSRPWRVKFSINFIGFLICSAILIILVTFKFFEGGWLTLVITSGFILIAVFIKRHYKSAQKALYRLDDQTATMFKLGDVSSMPPAPGRDEPTAVLLVSGFGGFGVHTFLSVEKLFPKIYKRYIFLSVGELDTGKFKGVGEVENLKKNTEENLQKYVKLANKLGFYAEYRFDVSVDSLETLVNMSQNLSREYPRSVFFAGKLVFQKEGLFNNILHNDTSYRLQRRLSFEGIQMVVMPIRVY